jgi:hypothetical protein
MSVEWQQPKTGRPAVAWLAYEDPASGGRGLLAKFTDPAKRTVSYYAYPRATREDFDAIMAAPWPVRAYMQWRKGTRGAPYFRLDREDAMPPEIEELLAAADRDAEQAVRCRVCGCVDGDCTDCVRRTGEPCYWVTEDLCSACVIACTAHHPDAIESIQSLKRFVRPITPEELAEQRRKAATP